MEIPMIYYVVVSTIMFFAGVYGFVTRHNLLAILISLAVAIAAAETAIAIAIIINIYRNIRNINVDNVDKMKY